jgi:hypothetical protein
MRIDATPWARDDLAPEDWTEIRDAEPQDAIALLSVNSGSHVALAVIHRNHPLIHVEAQAGRVIDAFRIALAKVTP